ncbi:MAG: protein-L-isoaspartate(D-aspartate) O-methyltransferase [Sphaerochaetaceae bacterium]
MEQTLNDFFHQLDRSLFIDNEYKSLSSVDAPLPIGYGQTISQPSLVLFMTEQLQLTKNCKVLEIGTGSGYQSVLLAQFAHWVYTVERLKELSVKAQKRFDLLGYTNISCRIGDGSVGWLEEAPFDRIMVTAASERTPEAIVQQLAPSGRMIVPVGQPGNQTLFLITRSLDGTLTEKELLKVAFVPLVGQYS